jgi:hypothetical protein
MGLSPRGPWHVGRRRVQMRAESERSSHALKRRPEICGREATHPYAAGVMGRLNGLRIR